MEQTEGSNGTLRRQTQTRGVCHAHHVPQPPPASSGLHLPLPVSTCLFWSPLVLHCLHLPLPVSTCLFRSPLVVHCLHLPLPVSSSPPLPPPASSGLPMSSTVSTCLFRSPLVLHCLHLPLPSSTVSTCLFWSPLVLHCLHLPLLVSPSPPLSPPASSGLP
ncbi:hypothetical protein EYF80_041640 [Liparis tanakae]|uniref:Uncharacterized protein n=1 Tax=Liparis tanakae TaxID=230148 RepID=A0A4Z2G4V3_9TELE|nr:hypothetical protein EYF80_041640 [Liparis tanakae]